MILSFTYQFKLLVGSIGTGLIFALIYHCFYLLLKNISIRQRKVIKGIFDIIYWLVFALTLFLIMLKYNKGEIRPYIVVGGMAGMLLYYILLKRIAANIISTLLHIISKILLLIITIIYTPISLVLCPIIKILHIIYFFCKKLLKKTVKYEKIKIRVLKKATQPLGGYILSRQKNKSKKSTNKANKKNNIFLSILMNVAIFIFIGGFVVSLCYQHYIHLQLNEEMKTVEMEIAEAKAESAALQKQYNNQDSPEFIEKVAREKLNMVHPTEIVYINSNSDEGKKLLNSIKRSSTKLENAQKEAALKTEEDSANYTPKALED